MPRARRAARRPTGAGLEHADDEALLDALAAHPQLIERPVVILRDPDRGDRALIARPPERLLELLGPPT